MGMVVHEVVGVLPELWAQIQVSSNNPFNYGVQAASSGGSGKAADAQTACRTVATPLAAQ